MKKRTKRFLLSDPNYLSDAMKFVQSFLDETGIEKNRP